MRYNSAKTSIRHIPALFKALPWKKGTKNLDYGGGKYNLTTKYLSRMGVQNIVYDPYNRDSQSNSFALSAYDYDTATICNVLNVIPNQIERITAIEEAEMRVKDGGKIYICVWAGDYSGTAKVSKSHTWQANKKLEEYIDDVKLSIPAFDYVIKSTTSVKYIEITI